MFFTPVPNFVNLLATMVILETWPHGFTFCKVCGVCCSDFPNWPTLLWIHPSKSVALWFGSLWFGATLSLGESTPSISKFNLHLQPIIRIDSLQHFSGIDSCIITHYNCGMMGVNDIQCVSINHHTPIHGAKTWHQVKCNELCTSHQFGWRWHHQSSQQLT